MHVGDEMHTEYLKILKERDHSEDLGVELMVRHCGLDSPGLGQRSLVGSRQHSNQPLGSIKGRFRD